MHRTLNRLTCNQAKKAAFEPRASTRCTLVFDVIAFTLRVFVIIEPKEDSRNFLQLFN